MTETPVRRDRLQEMTAGWWIVLLVGMLGLAAGIIVLAKPSESLNTLAVVAGIFILVDSLLEIVGSFGPGNPHRGSAAVLGVIGAIAGALLIRHPIAGVTAVALLIGIWLLAIGAMRLAGVFAARHRVWHLLVALLEIAAGVVIIAKPHIGYATLALLVGIGFIIRGAAQVVLGIALRSARNEISTAA